MNERLLQLRPKWYLCPYCGQWHEWKDSEKLAYYDGSNDVAVLPCINFKKDMWGNERVLNCSFNEENCWFLLDACDSDWIVDIPNIQEEPEKARITLTVNLDIEYVTDTRRCQECRKNGCIILKLAKERGDNEEIPIQLGFEFDPEEYAQCSEEGRKYKERQEATKLRGQEKQRRESAVEERKKAVQKHETAVVAQPKNSHNKTLKEETTMATKAKKTTLRAQLYEHSPKENVEIVKGWAVKYKPVLQWAIPVVSIYAAYRILNSQNSNLTVENINGVCEKEVGFGLDCLKDKKALKQLLVLGGLTAGAYGAIKAFSTITDTELSPDISVEEIEGKMSGLEAASKKFAWLQPKTEALLPVAISVIIVFAMTNPLKLSKIDKVSKKVQGWTEDLSIKVGVYKEMASLFIQDKFNLDLSSEEGKQKFRKVALLTAIGGILVFLYGKKLLAKKKEDSEEGQEEEAQPENQEMQTFMQQLLEILKKMAPTVFAAVTSVLVSKKLMEAKEDVIEGEAEVVDEETAPQETTDEEPAKQEATEDDDKGAEESE